MGEPGANVTIVIQMKMIVWGKGVLKEDNVIVNFSTIFLHKGWVLHLQFHKVVFLQGSREVRAKKIPGKYKQM